jgi:hypothetical protein
MRCRCARRTVGFVAVDQQPLGAGAGLLVQSADLIDDRVQCLRRGGVRRQVGETDAVPPVDPATTGRQLLADRLQCRFATPRRYAIGHVAQAADLLRRQLAARPGDSAAGRLGRIAPARAAQRAVRPWSLRLGRSQLMLPAKRLSMIAQHASSGALAGVTWTTSPSGLQRSKRDCSMIETPQGFGLIAQFALELEFAAREAGRSRSGPGVARHPAAARRCADVLGKVWRRRSVRWRCPAAC